MLLCCAVLSTSDLVMAEQLSEVIQRLEHPGSFTIRQIDRSAEEYQQEHRFQHIGPMDSRIGYTGRVDRTDSERPVIIWQGTEIRLRFTGDCIGYIFSGVRNRNWFNVIVDGQVKSLSLEGGGLFIVEGLGPGVHDFSLFKRSEAMYGEARFEGLVLPLDEKILSPFPRPLKMEFYGDSITAGACNEIEATTADTYDDLMLHNNYTSYGAICARRLGADYVNVAYSGIGLCRSWHELKMPAVWDKLYPRQDSPCYDFSDAPPDIVVINLGQNDFGYSEHIKAAFPSDFVETYIRFIRALRRQYPRAWIIMASGGMSGVKSSRSLLTGLHEVYKELSKEDDRLLSYIFKAFTYNHPRVDTHEKLALELEQFIRKSGILDQR